MIFGISAGSVRIHCTRCKIIKCRVEHIDEFQAEMMILFLLIQKLGSKFIQNYSIFSNAFYGFIHKSQNFLNKVLLILSYFPFTEDEYHQGHVHN